MLNERNKYPPHTKHGDKNFCVCDLNQRCGTTDCDVESIEYARCTQYIVCEMYKCFACFYVDCGLVLLHVRAITYTHTHTSTYTSTWIEWIDSEKKSAHIVNGTQKETENHINTHRSV